MASDKLVTIENGNWDAEVLQSTIPVLVDFWAEWCGPCRAIAPVLDQLAEEWDGKVKIAKVDVDSNQELAAEYKVRSIPMLLVMKNGEVAEQMVGAQSKPALVAKLQPHL
jgi:thioredoxin 1